MVSSFDAMVFARLKHKNQKRKYRGNAYIEHLAEVAGIVATILNDYPASGGRQLEKEFIEIILAICWLHDVMEDQGVTYAELVELFGEEVADGVFALSDLETGTRAERKAKARNRLKLSPDILQSIKCADLISNLKEIIEFDGGFTKVYVEEVKLLMKVMKLADKRLVGIVMETIDEYDKSKIV